jgi:hypothetical protein
MMISVVNPLFDISLKFILFRTYVWPYGSKVEGVMNGSLKLFCTLSTFLVFSILE